MAFTLNEMNREADDLQQMVFRRIDIWGNNSDFPQMSDFGITPQIRSESVCSNQFNCYACVRHQIEANDALVMPL
jgi:hypothetical protein